MCQSISCSVFWVSLVLIIYTYVGYPIVIWILSLIFHKRRAVKDYEASVSILIAAYNEGKHIAEKIANSLALDYPKEKLEIVVASDGSTDNTDALVRSFAANEKGVPVVLHRVEGRLGKTAAQNSAVRVCKGEVIVFSDAASMYTPLALRKLMRNYLEPTVGAVSGRYEYTNEGGSSVGLATTLFWKFENFIKGRQTRIRTITGCSGCIYSLRKKLYTDLPPQIISDLVEPLTILKKGFRIVFEPEALAYEETAGAAKEEFKMRVRVIVRGMNGMLFVRELFNPFKYPFVCFQLISHKILRWGVPVFAILAFVSNAFVFSISGFYQATFIVQLAFYILAVLGYITEKRGIRIKALYLPLYFCIVNLASLISMYRVVRGENIVTWQTKR